MSKVFKSFMSMVITALLLASLAVVASAAPPPGYVSKDATIDFECDAVAKLGPVPILPLNFDIVIDIEGYVPASLDPNEVYELLNSSATVTVPGNVISILDGVLGWNNVSGTVTTFEVISDNLPQVINVAPLTIESTPVPKDGSDLVFRVPANDGIDVGSFTAGSEGEVNISVGHVAAEFVNPLGSAFSLDANCQPISNPTLATININ